MFTKGIPAFGIKRVRIMNVGAITDLEIDLEDRSILAITAGNGVGKTTILEAISLIGHLPCFPTLERNWQAIEPSLLVAQLPFEQLDYSDPEYPWYKNVTELSEFPQKGLSGWLDSNRPGSGSSYGIIEYCLFDRRDDTEIEHHFAILIHASKLEKLATPRLTDILSRGEFDQNSNTDFSFADDRYLDSCGLIIHETNNKALEGLISQIALGRSFNIAQSASTETQIFRFSPEKLSVDTLKPRSVSYVNTDLNDFGRGNDLRESPKDLERDFGVEMIDRLNVEFNASGDFRHLAILREACAEILSTPVSHYSLGNVIPSNFHLEEISLAEKGASIKINRRDGTPSVDVNFLSAGENEVLFVVLMVLNACHNLSWGSSILLLDEPDLHIANSARGRFFDKIIELTSGCCQLIICTHSSAVTDSLRRSGIRPEQSMQSVFRVAEKYDPKDVKMISQFDGVFVERMKSINAATNPITEAWRVTKGLVRFQVVEMKSAIEAAGLSAYHVATIFATLLVYGTILAVSVLFTMGAVSLINDKEFPEDAQAFAWHGKVDEYLVPALFALAIPLILILAFRWNLRRLRRKLAKRIAMKST